MLETLFAHIHREPDGDTWSTIRTTTWDRSELLMDVSFENDAGLSSEGGYGKLAEGPDFVMTAYAGVLTAAGIAVSLSDLWPPLARAPLWVLEVGASLIVAERFRATMLSER